MKDQTRSFFRIVILVLIGLFIISCSIPMLNKTTPYPTNTIVPVAVQPTNTEIPLTVPTNPPTPTVPMPTVPVPTIPIPTNPPVVQAEANPTEAVSAPDYFTEEFEGDLSNWDHFFMSGEEDYADLYTEDGKMKFYLNGEEIYAYMVYLPYYYEDVQLDVVAENRGYNNNNVSMICRFDPDLGWYEFNIANSGLYNIYYYDLMNDKYNYIADGGSTVIHTGKDVNEYAIVCREKTLILYINGYEVRRLEENKYVLKEGMVGISVSSFNVFPIEVEFESVTISYPQ